MQMVRKLAAMPTVVLLASALAAPGPNTDVRLGADLRRRTGVPDPRR
ncbi:MAG TPA: hypothetical protein VH482_03350 [Thermomicrobiales bacterium]